MFRIFERYKTMKVKSRVFFLLEDECNFEFVEIIKHDGARRVSL